MNTNIENQTDNSEREHEEALRIPDLVDSILCNADETSRIELCDLLRIIAGNGNSAAWAAKCALTKAFIYHPEFKKTLETYIKEGGYDYTPIIG